MGLTHRGRRPSWATPDARLRLALGASSKVTIYGQATIDGSGSFFYRLNVEDNAEPGKDADRSWILVDNGYNSDNQTLMGGNVQIHTS